MPPKPQRNLAIPTDRDARRRADRLAAQELWAKVDANIAETLEAEEKMLARYADGLHVDLDDSITPRAVP